MLNKKVEIIPTDGKVFNPQGAKTAIHSKKGQMILKLLATLSEEYNTDLSVSFRHWHNKKGEFIKLENTQVIQECNGVQELVKDTIAIGQEVGWKLINNKVGVVERCSHR